MGICVDQGQKFERVCRACDEKIVIVSSGADLCRCPYCGVTLMDHDGSDPGLAMGRVMSCVLRYRNESDPVKRKSLKLSLESDLLWLLDDLVFFGKDQRRFHDWWCGCGWSGYWPVSPLGFGDSTCPACGGAVHQRPASGGVRR